MIVNGTTNATEVDDANGDSPSIALLAAITPNDIIEVYAEGRMAMNGVDNGSGFDQFFDVVAIASLDDLTIIFNGDHVTDKEGAANGDDASAYGGSLALSYAISDSFGVAGRFEHLNFDPNADDALTLNTETITLDFEPVESSDKLIMRLDGRFWQTSEDYLGLLDSDRDPSTSCMASTIGFVATTD